MGLTVSRLPAATGANEHNELDISTANIAQEEEELVHASSWHGIHERFITTIAVRNAENGESSTLNQYTLGETLRSGTWGEVVAVTDDMGRKLAMKVIQKKLTRPHIRRGGKQKNLETTTEKVHKAGAPLFA